jgi:hypothetical protein
MRDLYAPVLLLGLALALLVGQAIHLNISMKGAATLFASYLVVKTLILLIAIPLLVWTIQLALGTVPSAVLKLAAIATLPEAVFLLLVVVFGPCFGTVVALPVCLALSVMLFGRLFELEMHESVLCVVVTWGLGIGLNLLWSWVMFWLLRFAW